MFIYGIVTLTLTIITTIRVLNIKTSWDLPSLILMSIMTGLGLLVGLYFIIDYIVWRARQRRNKSSLTTRGKMRP